MYLLGLIIGPPCNSADLFKSQKAGKSTFLQFLLEFKMPYQETDIALWTLKLPEIFILPFSDNLYLISG